MRIQSLRDTHLFFPDIDGFWDIKDLNGTERRIRAELPYGDVPPKALQIEAVTQVARLFCLQDRMKEAKEFLDYAKQCMQDSDLGENLKLKARCHLEEGRFFALSMNPVRALESFRFAWELVREKKELDYLAIDVAFMISVTLPNKQGRTWFKTAMQAAETCEDNSLASRWRSYLYMHAGWQLFDAHDFLKSLAYFKKALFFCDKADIYLIQTLRWCEARVRRADGQTEAALTIQNEIFSDAINRIEEPNGFVYLEIGECYRAKQEFEKASVSFEIAYKKLMQNKWYSENFDDDLKEILKKSKQKKYG